MATTPAERYGKGLMRLQQGQIWKKDDEYLRIVEWARLSIEYKLMKNPADKKGTRHKMTKKEFCRLIRGAELLSPEEVAVQDGLDADDTADESAPPVT
jgi:hypothetical protein